MSFILDALKKAESERSRQTGPVLMDVRIAAPRRQLPAWAWVLGAVLLTNLVVLTVMFLRKPATRVQAEPPAVAATPAHTAATPVTSASIPAATLPAASLPASNLPAATASSEPAAATQPVFVGAAPIRDSAAAAPPFPQLPPGTAATAPPPRVTEAPLDLDTLPSAQDLIASGVTLPAMQLNLNVYDPAPASRYVLMNSTRLREGDVTPDGIKVERITPRGVVLEARGRRFLLPAGG